MAKLVDADVASVLERVEIDGQNVRLTGTLDRKLYVRVNDVLTRIGGKWTSGKTKAHVFPAGKNPAVLLDMVLTTGEMPEKNPYSFFWTPSGVAKEMISQAEFILDDLSDAKFLEPSAGEGAIAQVLVERFGGDVDLTLVELDENRAEKLENLFPGRLHAVGDFLAMSPVKDFDVVLMNPPFAAAGNPAAYIDHTMKAAEWLVSGGVVVAIAPAGFVFRSDSKTKGFREFVSSQGGWEELPEKSFSAAGTGVSTVMLWFTV